MFNLRMCSNSDTNKINTMDTTQIEIYAEIDKILRNDLQSQFLNDPQSSHLCHLSHEDLQFRGISSADVNDSVHDNSFTKYYSDSDNNFNLYLINEEVVCTQPVIDQTNDANDVSLLNAEFSEVHTFGSVTDDGSLDHENDADITKLYIKSENIDNDTNKKCIIGETFRELRVNDNSNNNCQCTINSIDPFNNRYHQVTTCAQYSNLHVCRTCGLGYAKITDLSEHLLSHTNVLNLQSDTKNGKIKKKQPKPTIMCSICNESFKSKVNMKKHLKTHQSINPVLIEDEPKMNLWSTELSLEPTTSQAIIPSTKPHICKFCQLSFTREKALVSHERIHAGDKWQSDHNLFTCKNCDKIFSEQSVLEQHFIKCIQKVRNVAKKRVSATKQLSSPIAVHSCKLNKHACTQCSKAFSTKQKMYRHMWIHRKKAFSCEVCAVSFGEQFELDEHRLSQHAEISPYVCPECGKSFASRQGLWEHNRNHGINSTQTYNCTLCTKTFTSRQGYLIHTRTHTGERPFECSYCEKSFRDGGTLRKHQRIHTGERPHSCPLCAKCFNQKVVLREHIRWVHASNKSEYPEPAPFCCVLCTVGVSDREELCTHIVKHSDQIAAFNKENAKQSTDQTDTIGPTKDECNVLTTDITSILDNKGAKCIRQVILRNRIILKRYKALFKASDAFLGIADSAGKHECQMCGNVFKSKEFLFNHVKLHI